MLHKIHDDMLAGMATESHERERVHRIDTSALSGTESINTPQRHVRTRLYFTSESHIFSLFNVLRWGGEATDGVTSIFNDECRAKFDAMEPCYLTHLVFRVLLRRGADPESPNSYTVQVLVSPGVNQHLHKGVAPSVMWDGAREFGIPVDDDDDGEKDEDPYRRGDLPEELLSTEPMILSSRDDLTLADVDAFFSAMYDAKTEVSVPPPPRAAACAAPRRPRQRPHQPSSPHQSANGPFAIAPSPPRARPNRRRATSPPSPPRRAKAARRRSSLRASAAGSPIPSSTPCRGRRPPQASSGGKATKTPAAAREASHPDSESGRDSFRGHKGEVGSMPRNLELPSSAAQPRWAGHVRHGSEQKGSLFQDRSPKK